MGARKMVSFSEFTPDALVKRVNKFYEWCKSNGYTVFDTSVAASGLMVTAYISYGPPEKR